MIEINKDTISKAPFKKELKIQLRKAIKEKKLRSKMYGLKSLKMGEGFRFKQVDKLNHSHSIGGGLSNFLMSQFNGNIAHIGINGWVEANIVMTRNALLDKRKSKIKGDSPALCKHVWEFLLNRVKLNKPFWEKLARDQQYRIKFFFLDSINSRDVASQFARESYESDNALVIFTYKRIKPYNYSNIVNLLDI